MPRTMSRRTALKTAALACSVPFVFRSHAHAAPSETVRHASFGASGMALSDVKSLSSHKNFKLVAVADVDRTKLDAIKAQFPEVVTYTDWRDLLEKEKNLDSVNVSTPDHMHAPIAMRCLQRGLNVYGQKPLTQTVYEARQLAKVAAEKKVVTQMGIQIHSHEVHKSIVQTIQSGVIGKVKEAHSWSGKMWGDNKPRPMKKDPIPTTLDWDKWLGVAPECDFIAGYYHPGEWRKRLAFGTGTFGDMGCHILDPVYGSMALTAPVSVQSGGDAPNEHNWGLETLVTFTFPGTKFTTDSLTLTWYNGNRRPPKELLAKVGVAKWSDQGSFYVGTDGVMFTPYIGPPVIRMNDGSPGKAVPQTGDNHYHQYLDAVRGTGKTSAPFSYAGPLTEFVLLGCLSTRFPNQKLEWDAAAMKVRNIESANAHVRKTYRKGWEVEGL